MEAFVKDFATYHTIKKAIVIESDLILDSLDPESSSITVSGSAIDFSDAGNWLILDGGIYLIDRVSPEPAQARLILKPALDAFGRPLEFLAQPSGQTIEGFIRSQLQKHWQNEDDPSYAIPYLIVSESGTTPFVPPELDGLDCFSLADYCRSIRRTHGISVTFGDGGNALICNIRSQSAERQQLSFDDGSSQLERVDFTNSGYSKLTVLCDVNTGDVNADNQPIYRRDRFTWYLSEDRKASQLEPARRAPGEWGIISVADEIEMEEKVREVFSEYDRAYKIEFRSTRELPVGAGITCWLRGNLLYARISSKRKRNGSHRYYYKMGELPVRASEKMRGALL